MMMNYEQKCFAGDEPRIDVTDEFIEKNKLTLSRSQDEILEKLKSCGGFNFKADVFIDYLNWNNSKSKYKDEYVEKVDSGKEDPPKVITNIKEVVQDFLDYMVFAWMKAQDERGISAGRSIDKLSGWMWILGREDIEKVLEDEDLYGPYGSPALIKACEMLDIKVPDSLKKFAGVSE